MIRACIIADLHFNEASRFEECVRLGDWIADDIAPREPDVILIAGDVFHSTSTPAERLAVAAWLRRLAALARVFIVRGNHDAEGDLKLFESLATYERVVVEEAAGVHLVAARDEARTRIAIGCLAWPRKAELLARLRAAGAQPAAKDVTDATAGQILRDIIRGLGAEMAQVDGPRILLAHALVRGSRTSPGQPLVGVDMEIGLEDLALAGADLVALGHIHRGQDWTWGGAPIVYPGSPRRTAFGESEAKCYLVADFDQSVCGCAHGWKRGSCSLGDCRNRGAVTWQRVEVPATPMVHVEVWHREDRFLTAAAAVLTNEDISACNGAEVRLRYHVASDQRDAGRYGADIVRRMMVDAGAVHVQVEEVVQSKRRARAPEVARATGLPDKLRALWQTRSEAPEREAQLLAKLTELDSDGG